MVLTADPSKVLSPKALLALQRLAVSIDNDYDFVILDQYR